MLPFEEEGDDEIEHQNSLVTPVNVTEKERITWLKKRIHDFKILESTKLSLEFHDRVSEFMSQECEAQFFMTWISPATLFGRREMLSLESLFKAHPNACLIILSRSLDSTWGNQILKPLTDRGFKVNAVTPNLPFLFQNTSAESWFNDLMQGKKDPGDIPLPQNLSNLIRLVILYKYGGIYVDADFIMIKPFKGLRNVIGAQKENLVYKNWTLNTAVLVFDKSHPLLLRFIEEFAVNFNGSKWGHNGPYLVTRVVEKVQEEDDLNLTVLPQRAFYPVNWTAIGEWFQKPKNKDELRWVRDRLMELRGQTYGVHLWNKVSGKLAIQRGSVIARLISQHCVFCNNIYSS